MRNLLLIMLVGLNAWAAEQWLCVEDSSQIQGSRVLACGVGVGVNEAQARSQALKSAQDEFSVVCGPDTECGDHKFSASPSRATCSETDGIWKCYRLVVYQIKEAKRDARIVYYPNVRDEGMDLMDRALEKELRNQE